METAATANFVSTLSASNGVMTLPIPKPAIEAIAPATREAAARMNSNCIGFFHRDGENDRAGNADNRGNEEGNAGSDPPQETPDKRSGRDRKAAHEIVEADCPPTEFRRSEIDDHCLSRGFADLAQSADDEGQH